MSPNPISRHYYERLCSDEEPIRKLNVAVMGGSESGKKNPDHKLHRLQTSDLGIHLKKLANVQTHFQKVGKFKDTQDLPI